MKKQMIKKLVINKLTVANLDSKNMDVIRGGIEDTWQTCSRCIDECYTAPKPKLTCFTCDFC